MKNETEITYVQIDTYSDFDMLTTDSIWVGCGSIPECPNAGFVNNYDEIEKYHQKLKNAGFKQIKTKKIEFGGSL